MKIPKEILIIRNDKLGDFMLIWPALSLIKSQYPDCTITALVPAYTEPMANLCPWIDKIIIDQKHLSLFSDARKLANEFKTHNFDAAISFFTENRTAIATWLAGIPVRIAPATKIAQIFSNKKLKQRRSQSAKPEHEYNTDLIRYYIEQQGDKPVEQPQAPYIMFDHDTLNKQRNEFIQRHDIKADTALVIVHPGSGGSAINLSIQQYVNLIKVIDNQCNAFFIITAGPGEKSSSEAVSSQLDAIKHCTFLSTEGIVAFSQFIAYSDLFISGSTGTLHIAGALDVPTAAFYSARQSATSLRWRTLNSKDHYLAFKPKKYTGENDMQTIDIQSCGQDISIFLEKLVHSQKNNGSNRTS